MVFKIMSKSSVVRFTGRISCMVSTKTLIINEKIIVEINLCFLFTQKVKSPRGKNIMILIKMLKVPPPKIISFGENQLLSNARLMETNEFENLIWAVVKIKRETK